MNTKMKMISKDCKIKIVQAKKTLTNQMDIKIKGDNNKTQNNHNNHLILLKKIIIQIIMNPISNRKNNNNFYKINNKIMIIPLRI